MPPFVGQGTPQVPANVVGSVSVTADGSREVSIKIPADKIPPDLKPQAEARVIEGRVTGQTENGATRIQTQSGTIEVKISPPPRAGDAVKITIPAQSQAEIQLARQAALQLALKIIAEARASGQAAAQKVSQPTNPDALRPTDTVSASQAQNAVKQAQAHIANAEKLFPKNVTLKPLLPGQDVKLTPLPIQSTQGGYLRTDAMQSTALRSALQPMTPQLSGSLPSSVLQIPQVSNQLISAQPLMSGQNMAAEVMKVLGTSVQNIQSGQANNTTSQPQLFNFQSAAFSQTSGANMATTAGEALQNLSNVSKPSTIPQLGQMPTMAEKSVGFNVTALPSPKGPIYTMPIEMKVTGVYPKPLAGGLNTGLIQQTSMHQIQVQPHQLQALVRPEVVGAQPVVSLLSADGDEVFSQRFLLQFPTDNIKPGDILTMQPVTTASSTSAGGMGTSMISGLQMMQNNSLSPISGTPFDGARQGWPALEEALANLSSLSDEPAQFAGLTHSSPMHAAIPQAASPNLMPAQILFLMSALRGGDMSNWLGEKTQQMIRDLGGKGGQLLERLARDISHMSSRFSEPQQTPSGEWRVLTFPFIGDGLDRAQIYYRNQSDEDGDDVDGVEKKKRVRFIMNLNMSRMGYIQLDGFAEDKLLNVIIRTEQEFSQDIRQYLRRRYSNVLESYDMTGGLEFKGTSSAVNVQP